MSSTTQPATTPARTTDENLVKARETAAKKATPEIAAILTGHRPIKLAQLIAAVVADAKAKGMGELTDSEIAKLGDPVVATRLLSGYTPERYGKGRWVSKATGTAARKAFAAKS